MELLEEKTEEAGREKHVPVVEKTVDGFLVRVGSIPHPMEEDHYIEWVELVANGVAYRRFLRPGDKPEAAFKLEAKEVSARAYCNKHGLWRSTYH